MQQEEVEVLVIGAGPAGSIAAAILNQEGHQVKVVEKQQFPRFVIGESLLPLCLDNFEKAGLLDAVRQQGFQIKGGASFVRQAHENCTFDFSQQHTDGYPHAWQMPRADLDYVLIQEAEKQGVAVCFQQTVEDVTFTDQKAIVSILDQTGKPYQVHAKFVIDASGYGRVLPRLLDLNEPSDLPSRTAFFTHIEDKNDSDDTERVTEIIDISKDAWGWVIPFASEVTSVGLVGNPCFFEDAEKHSLTEGFRSLLQKHPSLKKRFGKKDTRFIFEPKMIKGFSIGVKKMYGDRFILVGNSTEFLDPIFSSGVAFASESAATAATLVSKKLKGETVDFDKEYVQHMQAGIEVFRTYVKEWYTGNLQTVFFAEGKTNIAKEQICSVLAGYVWDQTNPYVKKHDRAIKVLAQVINMQKQAHRANKSS